jgi:zinc transporter ZupT
MGALARKELELARIEAHVDARRGLVAGGLGGVAALAGAIACAMIAAIGGLAAVMPRWLAAPGGCALFLAVAALFAALATVQARSARPERTLREARETVRALAHPRDGASAVTP